MPFRVLRPMGLSRGFYVLPALFGLGVGALALLVWQVQVDARRQIEELGTANSDSTQWFLAQTEVEVMALQRAVAEIRGAPAGSLAADSPETEEMRRRFDILYSRVQTLRQGASFAPLRDSPGMPATLGALHAILDEAIPVIDATDLPPLTMAARIGPGVAAALPLVRRVSLEGVRLFAMDSDSRRQGVAAALNRLSLLVVPLFGVLVSTLIGLFAMFRSARIQTARIAAARNRLQSLFEASIDAILVAHPDGRILGYNSAAQRIYGYDPETAIGGDVVELLTPLDQRPAVRALLDEVRSGARSSPQQGAEIIRTTARHQSGRIIPVELSLSVTADTHDPLLVAFVRDVSLRAAEEAELIEARDRALAGQQAKARMIAVMSHEMRTPLNGILGSLQLLQATPLDARQTRYLAAMDHSGRMLLQHVNDVLDASRAGSDRVDLAVAPVRLCAMLTDVIESLRQQAEARGNALILECHGPAGRLVMADRARLEQIVVNLVGNAIKFTENGRITVELDQTGPMTELRVTDTGIGIAEEDQQVIFDEFVTLGATFDRKVQGTGLGLSIVKGLVEAMGGTIDLASEPGEGTAFVVSLDLPEAAPAPVAAAPCPHSPPPARALSILMVEDNEINRMVAREMLADAGCSVTEACDGLDGVAAAASRRYDLILMDISMPRLNGVEAARRIRASGPNSATPIVALTAHAMDEDLQRFREAGMERALIKPLRRDQLAALLAATAPAGRADGTAPAPSDQDAAPPCPPALMARILTELREGTERLSAGLPDAEAAALAHRMAGSAAVGGLAAIHRLLAATEQAIRAPDPATPRPDLDELRQMLGILDLDGAAKSGREC